MPKETPKKNPKKENNKKENSKEEKNKTEKKSKYGLSKETLERIITKKIHKEKLPPKEELDEFSESRIFESNQFAKLKNKKIPVSLEAVNVLPQDNLGNIVSGWTNENQNKNNDSKKGNGFEYMPKNSDDNSAGKKYQSYELNPNIKTMKPEEVASSWSKPFTKAKDVKFIRYESNDSSSDPKYERVFTPKNLDEEEMKKLHDRKNLDFQFQEEKMHYYEKE